MKINMNKCLKLIVALFCVNIMAASLLKANNLVSYKGSKLSSINANYSRSKSSTMVKQTVLSSITAKELDIEVGANTDLKGSLIAAGYYDENGNFIDNGKLRLKTDSLTFSNLSNTRYDKSNSLSIGTNYAFKDPQQGEGSGSKDGGSQASTAGSNVFSSNQMSGMQTSGSIGQSGTSLQDKKNDTDPKSKISSINYSNNRNLSYAISKSLATIGKGELIVGDKDISSLSKDELASLQSDPNNKALYNSDDLTRLNRDSSKLSKELYSTKLNSSVDASVDMRLFSEGGRNEIKDDYNRASMIGNVGYNILMGDISFDKYFTELGRYNTSYEFDKEFGEPFAKAMSDKSLSLAEKKQIQEAYMNAKNYAMGLRTDITAVYLASPNGKNSQVLMGNFNPKNQTITTVFSTDKHNNIKTDFSSFYFVQSHENSHLQDFKDGIYRADIDGNQETRANARATDSLNYFNKALGISSKGNSDIGIYSFSASNSMANKSTLINNLRIFSGLDYSKSRNVDINKLDPESKTNII